MSEQSIPKFHNPFKHALQTRRPLIGLWLGLAEAYSAELLGGVGYDWLLIDNEHTPNDVRNTLRQLQAIASAGAAVPEAKQTQPVVRVPNTDPTLITQFLDIGAHNLLVPNIETAAQARDAVRAMRYPPDGTRSMGSGMARSSGWHRFPNYPDESNGEVCLIAQIETMEAVRNLDEIAAMPGVDAVMIIPVDLCADMGYRGRQGHPEVRRVIEEAIGRIRRAGKASGVVCPSEEIAKRYLELGAVLLAVGVDTTLLTKAAKGVLAEYQRIAATVPGPSAN